jgi:hypothetical protein
MRPNVLRARQIRTADLFDSTSERLRAGGCPLGRVLGGVDQCWVSPSTLRQRFVEGVQDGGQDVVRAFDSQREALHAAAGCEPVMVDADDPRDGWKTSPGRVDAQAGGC